jgi:hypothetical protein
MVRIVDKRRKLGKGRIGDRRRRRGLGSKFGEVGSG